MSNHPCSHCTTSLIKFQPAHLNVQLLFQVCDQCACEGAGLWVPASLTAQQPLPCSHHASSAATCLPQKLGLPICPSAHIIPEVPDQGLPLHPAGHLRSHLIVMGLLYMAYSDLCQHEFSSLPTLRPYSMGGATALVLTCRSDAVQQPCSCMQADSWRWRRLAQPPDKLPVRN